MDEKAELFFATIPETPLGPIGVAASLKGLVALEIGVTDAGQWACPERGRRGARYSLSGSLPPVGLVPFPVREQLEQYFAGKLRAFDLPIDQDHFTPFQKIVLPRVMAVPYGETRTYGEIAAEVGRPAAARAVGRANATNPLAIIIPCHRLVGADGSLRGYAGGLALKAWLLALEHNAHG